MEKNIEKYVSWIKRNKFLSVIIFIGIVVVGFYSFLFFGSYAASSAYSRGSYESIGAVPQVKSLGEAQTEGATGLGENVYQDEYKIKEGSAGIESMNADSDYQAIKENAEGYGGWAETVSKSENYKEISISTTLKIPAESFDAYADWLIQNFDVKSSNLKFYKISVERQQDEIEILMEALEAYDRLMERTESMEVTVNSISIMDTLTQKKLNIMRQLRSYGYQVENVQEKSNYATLTVTITQKKEIEIMPEDLWTDLMTKLRDAVRNITNALLDLVTIPIVILINLIVWIIYALVILIPLFIVYKFVMRFFKWLNSKIK